ncbi:lysosome-associated membrane glycoprotein 3 [Embiotoca jacksoni]|uniref:lysosome-associated membrane glycoprotein 3 n=1 Tax=Embiotoca jacksoni TaxID=100190 RepID=UPI00370442E2
MRPKAHTGVWSLLFLAAFVPGVHLRRDGSSIRPASNSRLPPEALIRRPVLQPCEATPPTGTYTLNNPGGRTCIRATMGVEYVVIENKKTWYFNLDPNRVRTDGSCGEEAAVLALALPGKPASLQFTFRKEKNIFYVTNLTAHLSPQPVCQGCAHKNYSGSTVYEKLFSAADGQSFMCKSENLLLTSSELRIKLVSLQIQAFDVQEGKYGKGVECWADFNKRAIPIIVVAVGVGLILIAALTCLFVKDRRVQGYESL